MARKVILDVDPGYDDALALCYALADPELDILAVTAVGGNCSPAHATRNVQAIIEVVDPPRLPRVGSASDPEASIGLPPEGRGICGPDGMGGVLAPVAERQHLASAEKVICDQVRANPDVVTIVALGPLTNIARAFKRDPELPKLVGRIVIAGGSFSAQGNVTPAAEFNVFCDPPSARAVFRSASTKTLVPLDVTSKVVLSYDIFQKLPDESTRLGGFLRKILTQAFWGHRQKFGMEGIHIHDTVALLSVCHPELFRTHEMLGDVELTGELTTGMTVFDRRRQPGTRHNMEVAFDAEKESLIELLTQRLSTAGPNADL